MDCKIWRTWAYELPETPAPGDPMAAAHGVEYGPQRLQPPFRHSQISHTAAFTVSVFSDTPPLLWTGKSGAPWAGRMKRGGPAAWRNLPGMAHSAPASPVAQGGAHDCLVLLGVLGCRRVEEWLGLGP